MKKNKGATLYEVIVAMMLITMITLIIISVSQWLNGVSSSTIIRFMYANETDNITTCFQSFKHGEYDEFTDSLDIVYPYYEHSTSAETDNYSIYYDIDFNVLDNKSNYYYFIDIKITGNNLDISVYKSGKDDTLIYQAPTYRAGVL